MCVRVGAGWGRVNVSFFGVPGTELGWMRAASAGWLWLSGAGPAGGAAGAALRQSPALGAERGLLLVIRGFWGRGTPEKGKYLGIMEWLHNSYPVLPGQKPNLFCYSESCFSGTQPCVLACARVDSRFRMHFD